MPAHLAHSAHPPHFATRALLALLALLRLLACVLLGAASLTAAAQTIPEQLAALEAASGGRLGVVALDAQGEKIAAYRGDERFPMTSTFKFMLVAAILQQANMQADAQANFLARHIAYPETALVPWSPVTKARLAEGLSVAELCAAALRQSDNTAANLLLQQVGGPAGLTAFARSIGDAAFRLDRWEGELNSAIPGDERDTSTPAAMAESLRKLAFGAALPASGRALLLEWMVGNTTGNARIRAGLPPDWRVADKTGSGPYGTVNDVAVLWPPTGSPLILAVYYTQETPNAPAREDILATVARLLAKTRAAAP
jgi:beta-lactamase class A